MEFVLLLNENLFFRRQRKQKSMQIVCELINLKFYEDLLFFLASTQTITNSYDDQEPTQPMKIWNDTNSSFLFRRKFV